MENQKIKFNPKNMVTIYRDDVFLEDVWKQYASHPCSIKGVDKDNNEFVNFILVHPNDVIYEEPTTIDVENLDKEPDDEQKK